MPPILALILCIIFVLWLLTLDHKSAPNNSIALWLPVLWTLLIASRPLAAWFPSPISEGEMGSPLDRNFIISLIIASLFVLFKRRFAFLKVINQNIWLMILAFYMLVSSLWADIFFTSFVRWAREIMAAVIMSFVILSENNAREAMQSVLRKTSYILIPFSLLLIKYYPLYGVQYARWSGELMWTGVTMHKTSFGRLCLIVIFFLTWSLIKRWKEHSIPVVKYQTAAEIFLLILSFYLLIGPSAHAMSATAIISLAVGLTAFIVFLWLNKLNIYPSSNAISAIMLTIIIYGTFTVFTSGTFIEPLTAATFGRDATLTGRTEIWQQYLPMAMEHPFLGHGFGGFWTTEAIKIQKVTEVHNGYLEVILHLGFIGLIFVALFLLSSCRRAQRMMKDDLFWAILWICFLFITIIHNISESSIDSFSKNLTAILVFMAVSSSSITEDSENFNG